MSLPYFCKKDTPRYRGMPSELDCWMEWIDNQMADEVYEPQGADDFDDFIGGTSFFSSLAAFSSPFCT